MVESGYQVQVRWDVCTSVVLEGNAAGDPATRQLPVLLPPGYTGAGEQRYPVLYGLAGFGSRGAALLNDDGWEPNLRERLERLYAAGMPPVIVVLPDCFSQLGGSQYLNSSATGRYEDYLVTEIVSYVDSRYRTIPEARARGLFGTSSGGYGALVLSMRHPDRFSAVACHSGDCFFDLCYRPAFPKAANALNAAGGLAAWFETFRAGERKSQTDFDVAGVVGLAACYSPNPLAPLGLDLPFDPYTCLLDEAVWARWLAWDPVRLVERYEDALRSLRLLYLDCGHGDEYNLHFGARLLTNVLRERDIAYDYEEFDGGHRGTDYRYDVSLPRLAPVLHEP